MFLRCIVICIVSIACITSKAYCKDAIDQEILELEKSIQKSQSRLQKILKNKHRSQSPMATNTQPPFYLAKDYTRYPENPYPNLFEYTSKDGSNNIQFHFWYQGDWDSLMNIHGLLVNDGLIQTPILRNNSVQRFWNRRVRPTVQGDIDQFINYFLNIDFGRNSIALYDGFVDINYYRLLGLQLGKQMSLLSGIENYFENFNYLSRAFTMEVSHTAMLAPNRQTGMVLHGSLGPSGHEPYYQGLSLLGFDDFFSYQLGLLTSTADNSIPTPLFNPDSFTLSQPSNFLNYDFEARIFTNPFIAYQGHILQHLGLGIAFGTGNPNNQQELPSLFSIAQNIFYFYEENYPVYSNYSVIANGLRQRIHPQAVWSYGPLGIIGDWTRTNQTLALYDNNTNTYPYQSIKQANSASMISLIYNLTQEEFNLFHLIPNRNFHFMSRQDLGAWQLTLRFSQLNLDPSVYEHTFNKTINSQDYLFYYFVDPRTSIQKANSWSVGLNWYWNQYLRLTFEYDQSSYLGGCSTGAMSGIDGVSGCQTGNLATYLPNSQVQNRPDEKVFMQRIQLTF